MVTVCIKHKTFFTENDNTVNNRNNVNISNILNNYKIIKV